MHAFFSHYCVILTLSFVLAQMGWNYMVNHKIKLFN